MAEQLIKIAAERQVRSGQTMQPPEGLYDEFCARFPYVETDDQSPGHRRRARRPRVRQADGPADLRRCRLRQDRGGPARRLRRRHGRQAGRRRDADDAARRQHLTAPSASASGPAGAHRRSCRGWSPARTAAAVKAGIKATARSTSSSAPMRCWPRASSSRRSAC